MTAIRLGNYLLLERIAAGDGLLRHRHPHAGPVAIKRIHPHLADEPAMFEMFRDEAMISRRLAQPNICATLDFDVDDPAVAGHA